MAPGDKELMKAFEETTTRNVRAAVDHGNETRRLFRDLESKVKRLEAQLIEKDKKLEELNNGLNIIRAKVFSGATT